MYFGKKWLTVAGAVACMLLVSARAHAGPTLDFGIVAPTAGSIGYAGGAAPLIGSGIEVDNVVGLDTVLNNGVLRNCFSCTLNFTTGANSGSGGFFWTFSGGGTISLVGGIDLNNDGDATDPGDIPIGSTLFSGSFSTGATVLGLGDTFKIAGASFADLKNDRLVEFYGLPQGIPYVGKFNISFEALSGPSGPFASSRVLSGDITNSPTPEPATVLLLGSGLIGFGYLARRRRSH